MKIFEIRPIGGYCGGCMLVQANSKGDALELAKKENYEVSDGFRVQEIYGLHYDVNEPCVITDALYFE